MHIHYRCSEGFRPSGVVVCVALAALSSLTSSLYSSYHSFICPFVPPPSSFAVISANFDATSCAEDMLAADCQLGREMEMARIFRLLECGEINTRKGM
ncbi:hypothetical protein BKA64DRAFT_212737 [Cadophora sp. MPI-SDFR-AT-0126]|nr:hypothetical protein BKA64DRAFT_212737 [Leotiomycetes sp. MPI-SDFR-AT-0126]